MATIFRGPTYASPQRKPPQPSVFWTTALLTPALLLSGAVPFKSPTQEVVAQQHPSHARSANPDTSQGLQKVRFADSAKAFFNPPTFAPVAKGVAGYLHPDTSQSVPKALYADARNAFANPPHKAPDRLWPVTDTSQESSLALLSTLLVQPPVVNVPTWTAPLLLWKGLDSSAGTPKVLYADSVAPLFNPAQLQVDRLRPVADTSQASARVLLSAVLPPFVNPPGYQSPKFFWQPADASFGTAKALYADSVAPQFNPPQLQVDRLRPVVDTTRGVLPAFFPTVAPPFVNPPHRQVGVPRSVVDTSTGASLALLSFVPQPPFANPPPTLSPRFFWQPADTSAGIPKPSVGDDALPTFNPPFLTADRIRPVTDTSRGFTIGVTGAPFAQWDWPAPIARVHRQFHGWDQQANPGTIPDALPVFPPPDKVLAGFVYGPHGNDYTGTLVVTTTSGGGVYLRRR